MNLYDTSEHALQPPDSDADRNVLDFALPAVQFSESVHIFWGFTIKILRKTNLCYTIGDEPSRGRYSCPDYTP